jgi:hypothetical protein
VLSRPNRPRLFSGFSKLPDSDASKIKGRIQDSVPRVRSKPRRQKPVVSFRRVAAKSKASESPSWQIEVLGEPKNLRTFLALAKWVGFVGRY